MTAFDFVVIGVVGISTLMAFMRGFMRVVASLVAWVVGLLAAVRLASPVGGMLPDFGGTPAIRYVVAFIVILVAALIVGALIGYVLSRLLELAGLGFINRALGAVVGFARGIVIVVLLVLLAGLTELPRADWWQNAWLSRPFVTAALTVRPCVPRAWAERLDYSGKERRPAKAVVKAEGATGTMRGSEA
jgi:membrane protein required for colicin V production